MNNSLFIINAFYSRRRTMKLFFNKPKTSHGNRTRDLSRPSCNHFIISFSHSFYYFYIYISFHITSIEKRFDTRLEISRREFNPSEWWINFQEKTNFNSHLNLNPYKHTGIQESWFKLAIPTTVPRVSSWRQIFKLFFLWKKWQASERRKAVDQSFIGDLWLGGPRKRSRAVLKRVEKHTFGRIAVINLRLCVMPCWKCAARRLATRQRAGKSGTRATPRVKRGTRQLLAPQSEPNHSYLVKQ